MKYLSKGNLRICHVYRARQLVHSVSIDDACLVDKVYSYSGLIDFSTLETNRFDETMQYH